MGSLPAYTIEDGILEFSPEVIITNEYTIKQSDKSKIKEVIIPETMRVLGKDTFTKCKNLESVTIMNGLQTIGNSAFLGCVNLNNVEIPKSVKTIEYSAFMNCSNLREITLDCGLTSVEHYAFAACENIRIYINDIASWCKINFADFSANPLSHNGVLYVDKTPICDLIIPEGVTSIGKHSFSSCHAFDTVHLPASIKRIGEGAFSFCKDIAKVYTPSLSSWCSIFFETSDSNPLFYAESLYVDNKPLDSDLVIPENVKLINSNAFPYCENIKSVTIPGNVKVVGVESFYACPNLESIKIEEGVEFIDDGAFARCELLRHVSLPSSIRRITTTAFDVEDKEITFKCRVNKAVKEWSQKYNVQIHMSKIDDFMNDLLDDSKSI